MRTDTRGRRRTCEPCRTDRRTAKPRPESKRCSRCKSTKPPAAFYENQGKLRSSCRACDLETKAAEWPRVSAHKSRYIRDYYRKNRERIAAQVSAYQATHREQSRLARQRREARLMGNGGTLTQQEWREILEVHDRRCAYCLERGSALQMDHVIAVVRGGDTSADNIVPACQSCNSSKGSKPIFMMARFLT